MIKGKITVGRYVFLRFPAVISKYLELDKRSEIYTLFDDNNNILISLQPKENFKLRKLQKQRGPPYIYLPSYYKNIITKNNIIVWKMENNKITAEVYNLLDENDKELKFKIIFI